MTALVLELRRFRTALEVAGIIRFGLFEAVAAWWLSGYPLSFTAPVGVIALIGTEMRNLILFVDVFEKRMGQGVDLVTAVKEADELRFRPVLLTSAIAFIGGLVSSTLLSRVAPPLTNFLIRRCPPVMTSCRFQEGCSLAAMCKAGDAREWSV